MTSVDLSLFFPPGARVVALPSWRNPRLYLATQDPLQRWNDSSFYPAYRLRARLYRLMLRLGVAARITGARKVRSSEWTLREFCQDVLPQLASVVVLVGTPGPTQGITVQLRDGDGHAIGYLKYAEKEAARRRLQQEHVILSNLPDGVGPKPARLGALGNGKALLTSALSGRPLPITLPPPENLTNLLDSLIVSPPVPFESHPWVRQAPNRENPELDAWCERLGDRNWPVVIAHGDFAPWNLLRSTNGAVLAIDWEYGTLRGFPYLDLAYYVLQTLALVYRQTPSEALWYTTEYLSRQRSCSLNNKEAEALVRLTAYDAYQKALVDGHSAEADLQAWRRAIWEGTTRP